MAQRKYGRRKKVGAWAWYSRGGKGTDREVLGGTVWISGDGREQGSAEITALGDAGQDFELCAVVRVSMDGNGSSLARRGTCTRLEYMYTSQVVFPLALLQSSASLA